MSDRIQCSDVNYRKGYIEITQGIHAGCVNLETWNVDPDIDLSVLDIRDDNFPDAGITGNTEIELNPDQVRELIRQLQNALDET